METPTATRRCTCYVKDLPEPDRFPLHNGAHSLDCPVYRESLDPVDALHDREARFHLSGQGTCPWCAGEVS